MTRPRLLAHALLCAVPWLVASYFTIAYAAAAMFCAQTSSYFVPAARVDALGWSRLGSFVTAVVLERLLIAEFLRTLAIAFVAGCVAAVMLLARYAAATWGAAMSTYRRRAEEVLLHAEELLFSLLLIVPPFLFGMSLSRVAVRWGLRPNDVMERSLIVSLIQVALVWPLAYMVAARLLNDKRVFQKIALLAESGPAALLELQRVARPALATMFGIVFVFSAIDPLTPKLLLPRDRSTLAAWLFEVNGFRSDPAAGVISALFALGGVVAAILWRCIAAPATATRKHLRWPMRFKTGFFVLVLLLFAATRVLAETVVLKGNNSIRDINTPHEPLIIRGAGGAVVIENVVASAINAQEVAAETLTLRNVRVGAIDLQGARVRALHISHAECHQLLLGNLRPPAGFSIELDRVEVTADPQTGLKGLAFIDGLQCIRETSRDFGVQGGRIRIADLQCDVFKLSTGGSGGYLGERPDALPEVETLEVSLLNARSKVELIGDVGRRRIRLDNVTTESLNLSLARTAELVVAGDIDTADLGSAVQTLRVAPHIKRLKLQPGFAFERIHGDVRELLALLDRSELSMFHLRQFESYFDRVGDRRSWSVATALRYRAERGEERGGRRLLLYLLSVAGYPGSIPSALLLTLTIALACTIVAFTCRDSELATGTTEVRTRILRSLDYAVSSLLRTDSLIEKERKETMAARLRVVKLLCYALSYVLLALFVAAFIRFAL